MRVGIIECCFLRTLSYILGWVNHFLKYFHLKWLLPNWLITFQPSKFHKKLHHFIQLKEGTKEGRNEGTKERRKEKLNEWNVKLGLTKMLPFFQWKKIRNRHQNIGVIFYHMVYSVENYRLVNYQFTLESFWMMEC